jgi:hypothetical protein
MNLLVDYVKVLFRDDDLPIILFIIHLIINNQQQISEHYDHTLTSHQNGKLDLTDNNGGLLY